jgi:hypothetical protein
LNQQKAMQERRVARQAEVEGGYAHPQEEVGPDMWDGGGAGPMDEEGSDEELQ